MIDSCSRLINNNCCCRFGRVPTPQQIAMLRRFVLLQASAPRSPVPLEAMHIPAAPAPKSVLLPTAWLQLHKLLKMARQLICP